MAFAPKTQVRILSFVGAGLPAADDGEVGSPCWKEKGVICKPRRSETPPSKEWFIVQYEDGGKMCIHQDRLMIANEAA